MQPMMTIDEVLAFFQLVARRPTSPTPEDVAAALHERKRLAITAQDQHQATFVCCLEGVLHAQNGYLKAFEQLKADQLFEAWCTLEQVELALDGLNRHNLPFSNDCRLPFIYQYVRKWQSLFPYKFFMSPELLVEKAHCSICEQPIGLRKRCAHRIGEIYDGEQCARVITEFKLLGLALVTNPVQKYSALRPPDERVYTLLRYAAKAVQSPFDAWDAKWTKRRQPHSRFGGVGRNEPCPCESNKKYKKCCLNESGVLRPHVEFDFGVHPPADVPPLIYTD